MHILKSQNLTFVVGGVPGGGVGVGGVGVGGVGWRVEFQMRVCKIKDVSERYVF